MFRAIRMAGGLNAASRSSWRSRRLLILCYHGFSRSDEHDWDPRMYVTAAHFEARLRFLAERDYAVLPLSEGLNRLAAGTLPPRAVAITVDDGNYDFYAVAYPLLQRLGVPATVYVSTYHVVDQRPVFDVASRYLLWKALSRGPLSVENPEGGSPYTITNTQDYEAVSERIYRVAREASWSAERKHEWLEQLAGKLGIDWQGFLESRAFSLMRPEEIGRLDPAIADVQLHTHRHRVPEDRELFLRELRENRSVLADCGVNPAGLTHFCYPSGVHRRSFLQWLEEAGVTSAVTGTPGLASRHSHRFLLPRFVDASTTSEVEFEAWASGLRHFVHRPTRAFAVDV